MITGSFFSIANPNDRAHKNVDLPTPNPVLKNKFG